MPLALATHRAITFAEYVGAPMLIVHVSGRDAATEIGRARQRVPDGVAGVAGAAGTAGGTAEALGGLLPIFGETCPQYLTLTTDRLKGIGAPQGHGHDQAQGGRSHQVRGS